VENKSRFIDLLSLAGDLLSPIPQNFDRISLSWNVHEETVIHKNDVVLKNVQIMYYPQKGFYGYWREVWVGGKSTIRIIRGDILRPPIRRFWDLSPTNVPICWSDAAKTMMTVATVVACALVAHLNWRIEQTGEWNSRGKWRRQYDRPPHKNPLSDTMKDVVARFGKLKVNGTVL
jgi:hypothetical protein